MFLLLLIRLKFDNQFNKYFGGHVVCVFLCFSHSGMSNAIQSHQNRSSCLLNSKHPYKPLNKYYSWVWIWFDWCCCCYLFQCKQWSWLEERSNQITWHCGCENRFDGIFVPFDYVLRWANRIYLVLISSEEWKEKESGANGRTNQRIGENEKSQWLFS